MVNSLRRKIIFPGFQFYIFKFKRDLTLPTFRFLENNIWRIIRQSVRISGKSIQANLYQVVFESIQDTHALMYRFIIF